MSEEIGEIEVLKGRVRFGSSFGKSAEESIGKEGSHKVSFKLNAIHWKSAKFTHRRHQHVETFRIFEAPNFARTLLLQTEM